MAATRALARAAGVLASGMESYGDNALVGKTALEEAAIAALETADENSNSLVPDPLQGTPLLGKAGVFWAL